MVSLATRTRVIVVQHQLELQARSNTGRHAAAALSHLEVRLFGAPGQALRVDDLAGAWLLWPGEAQAPSLVPPPSTLVVLDGSWSQARKMWQRVPELRGLQRWSLPAPAGRRSLREAPPGGMSTLETLAEALEALEGRTVGDHLRAVHEALVQKQLADRGYVGSMRGA